MKTLLLVLYILLILGVIFMERKSPTEALLWVLVLVCIPYVGVLLYLVFGSTAAIRITAYARKKRLKERQPGRQPQKAPDLSGYALSEEDRQVLQFNSSYNQSQVTCYDDLQFFINGESHYRQLFADIRAARECIYIEFYTIHHDSMGEALVKALTAKAKEGVRVMVMCDFIANLSTPSKMFKPLREAGGQVIRVKPFLTHYRSHRKIVVIDHAVSYIGGMNMGEKYADLCGNKKPWRDTQVRMTGPCCAVLDSYFLTDWLCSVRRRDWEKEAAYADTVPDTDNRLNSHLCQFIMGGVDTPKESVKMCYLSLIRSAKKRICIQTPYFIPDASILDALKAAAAAGVEILLMIPGIKASFFLDPVTTYYGGQLLEYGAKIYKYHGYVHAKTLLIDDEICCVGSVNMDMRSLMVDDEICGVFYDNSMVARYGEIFRRDLDSCDSYTYRMFRERSRRERFWESVFLLFAPLM